MRTFLRALTLGVGFVCLYATCFSQQTAKRISYPASPDGVIGFLEFRPSDYGSQRHPLIIFLHGIGERGNGTSQIASVAYNGIPYYCANGASMRFTAGGQTSSFVVLSPQLSVQYGSWPTYYVKEMINYAKANLQIDPNRIYVTGLSLGGGGVWKVITDATNGDYSFDAGIAAAAPVCGTQEENDANVCSTIGANHLPVWAFHSMDDGTVGVGATQHAQILLGWCGAITPTPIFTYYQSGGHSGAWVNAYDTGHITRTVNVNGNLTSFTANPNLYEWFLSQTRSVAPVYTPPVANAGLAQSITLPLSTVTLTGTGTGTNGATISSYSWAKTSGPSAGIISLPLLNTTVVTGLVAGTYVFTLTVTDNHGLTSSSSVTITVNPAFFANQAPTVNAGADQNINLPANSVVLNGTAADQDGYISAYAWTKTSGPSSYTIQSPGSASTTISNLVAGRYVFSLKATDNGGATASSSLTINVNTPPIVNPGSNVTITLPANSVALDGRGTTDPDGTIVGWEWTKTSGPSTYTIASPYNPSTTISNLVQGTYVFSLKATDNAQASSSAGVTITVNPQPVITGTPPPVVNQAPVSNAGPDITLTLPATTSLDASASYDPDGTIIEYYWSQSSGPSSGVIANAFGLNTPLNNLVPGVYSFVLQVKDNSGALSYSMKKITVNAAIVQPPPASNLLGYIKSALNASAACSDASADGRTAIYGSSIIEGNTIYTDAAATQPFNGAWRWYSFTPVLGGAITNSFAVNPNGGTLYLGACAVAPPPPPPPPPSNLLGYIKQSASYFTACGDASSDGRTAVYGTSISNGSILYTDAAMTQVFNGGWNWYSFTPTLGGPTTYAFAVYPIGSIFLLGSCSGNVTPPPPPSNLLGYIKQSGSYFMACGDASSDGRTAVYGTSISNGSILYTDAAMTQVFNGGWNWYSFTPTLGGTATYAFAVYPIGSIFLLGSCNGSARLIAPAATTTANAIQQAVNTPVRLNIFPNPVRNTATIELHSAQEVTATVFLYNTAGVMTSKYTWAIVKGNNTLTLKNISVMKSGFYVADIRDNSGKAIGKLKFIKM